MPNYSELGASKAILQLGLDKLAFAGALGSLAKLMPGVASKVTSIGTKLTGLGTKLSPAVSGVGKEMGRQALGGAGFGGLLMGGLQAAGAPEGQRLEAFGQGAVQGAGMGAIGGAAMGAGGKLMENAAHRLGTKSLIRQTPTLSTGQAGTQMTDALNRGIWGNYKAYRAATSPADKQLAALGGLGSLGREAGSWGATALLPGVMGGFGVLDSAPKQAEYAPPHIIVLKAPEDPHKNDLLPQGSVGGAVGGTLGLLSAAVPLIMARAKLPPGSRPWYMEDVAARVIPAVTGAAGGLAGTAIENKLKAPPEAPVA